MGKDLNTISNDFFTQEIDHHLIQLFIVVQIPSETYSFAVTDFVEGKGVRKYDLLEVLHFIHLSEGKINS